MSWIIVQIIVAAFNLQLCASDTSWFETRDGEVWAVCGDEDGDPLPDWHVVILPVQEIRVNYTACHANGWDDARCVAEAKAEIAAIELCKESATCTNR